MKIALVQMANAGSIEANLDRSVQSIAQAAAHGADIVVFPEVHLTEFFPQFEGRDVSAYRLGIDSPEVRRICDACRECKIMAIPNIYLEESGSVYDASLVISAEGKVLGVQKMVHIAQAPCFYEQDYYRPSNDGFKVFDTPLGKLGVVVCFDRHYPESIRTEALMGADIVFVPTVNTKAEPNEMFEWEMRVQAFQNCVSVAMCNRVGAEGAMEFAGQSIVIDAHGAVVAKADDAETILYADIDLADSAAARASRPYTNLRRREWYC